MTDLNNSDKSYLINYITEHNPKAILSELQTLSYEALVLVKVHLEIEVSKRIPPSEEKIKKA
jgi:hypothetical protein